MFPRPPSQHSGTGSAFKLGNSALRAQAMMTYGMMPPHPGAMSVGALMKSMDSGSVISKHALFKNIEQ